MRGHSNMQYRSGVRVRGAFGAAGTEWIMAALRRRARGWRGTAEAPMSTLDDPMFRRGPDYHNEKRSTATFMFPQIVRANRADFTLRNMRDRADLAQVAWKIMRHAKFESAAQNARRRFTFDSASQVSDKNPKRLLRRLKFRIVSQITRRRASVVSFLEYLDKMVATEQDRRLLG